MIRESLRCNPVNLTRRGLLRAAGAAAVVMGLHSGTSSSPAAAALTQTPGRRVAVLGGGMAGLTAAHELAERGFEVTVYERKALGGKARSIPVPGTGTGGRRPLPGEHGFRFFPGFYHHVPDTMRRIPFRGNANGVWDNLVDVGVTRISRTGDVDATLPVRLAPVLLDPETLRQTLIAALRLNTRLPPTELAEFIQRFWIFLTSCDARRFGQWEYVPWWEFVRAEGKSAEYQVLAQGLTRNLVAAKETLASSRTIAYILEALLMNIMGRGSDGALDRVLNGPTNETWIGPWLVVLRNLGVKFRMGTVESIDIAGGRIASVRVRDGTGRAGAVQADWFICAVPVERAVQLWSPEVLSLDPELQWMKHLIVDWMNGLQFYLRRVVPITAGHVTYLDSPWALTSISQAQFWTDRDFTRDYGDGTVKDCLSVDISDWDTPGIIHHRPAKECTEQEIVQEVWVQLKAALNDTGPHELADADLHSWFLDPAITWSHAKQKNTNDEPLLINTVGSWPQRPQARTAIPNLFLAGDFVQTNVDLATMEGANESARAAVNALLHESGSSTAPAPMWTLYQPPELGLLKQADEVRYDMGQPNIFDSPLSLPARFHQQPHGQPYAGSSYE